MCHTKGKNININFEIFTSFLLISFNSDSMVGFPPVINTTFAHIINKKFEMN